MKSIAVIAMVFASGVFGWSLRQPTTSKTTSPQLETAPVKPQVRTRVVDGNNLFRESVRSSIWIRSEQNGKLGTRFAFVRAIEAPPMSGKFFPVEFVLFDRPDLEGRLVENIEHGIENVSAFIEIQQQGKNRVPVLRVLTGNKNRIVTIQQDQMPESLDDLWKLAEPYIQLLGCGE